jgi:acid phosphatase family membrane protein YuiD
MGYLIAPFVAWLVAGSTKFLVNTVRSRRLAWEQIGYGGFPSTHTTIVTTTAGLVGLREGWDTPMFAVAVTLAFIVVLDATSLRRQIGYHAEAINRLTELDAERRVLRERMGHRRSEVLAGVGLGVLTALLLDLLAG